MGDFILLVNCYLYGIIIIMLAVLLLLVYVRGQISHTFTNPFEHKDIKYQCSNLANGIVFGKRFGLTAYSPEQDEGHKIGRAHV